MHNNDWKAPDWLAAAITSNPQLPGPRPVPAPDAGSPQSGDLWLVDPVSGVEERRVVLVLALFEDKGIVSCLLTTHLIDAADNCGVVIPPEESKTGYPILIERLVIGPLWVSQLVARVGQLDQQFLPALSPIKLEVFARGGGTTIPTSLPKRQIPINWVGLPLKDNNDWRVLFVRDELVTMNRLCADCIHKLGL